jgi:hypothetical protein
MTRRITDFDFDEGDLITAREGAVLMRLSTKRFYAVYGSLAIKLPRRRHLWDRRELVRLLREARSAIRDTRRRRFVAVWP